MPAGLQSRFNILETSPLTSMPPMDQAGETPEQWKASRFNVHATGEDGSLILWNTLTGAISVFPPSKVRLIKKALRGVVEAKRKGTIRYLADKGFLVRASANEYRQFQVRFGSEHFTNKALEFILLPSEDCNFRCEYCYEDFRRGTMREEVRAGIKRLTEDRAPYLDRLSVSWFGGEPLYGWEAIEELAPFFSDVVKRNGLSYRGYMTTNGYLLTPEISRKLLGWGVTGYQITVDGVAEDHDRSRPGRDGSPTFQQIYNNLKAMRSWDGSFDVAIRINIGPRNSSRIPKLLDMLAADFGGDPRYRISYQLISKWGGDNDDHFSVCGKTEGQEILRSLMAAAKERELILPQVRSVNHFGSSVCYAARPYNFLIGADGQVMKCTVLLDKDVRNVVGRITPEGELILDDDRMALWTEPVFERDQQCQKCVFLPNCSGSYCPLPRIETGERKCLPARSDARGTLRAIEEESRETIRSVNVNSGRA